MQLSLLDLHRQYLVHRGRSALPSWHASLLRRCGQTRIGDENRHSEREYWQSNEGRRRFVHHLRAADFGTGGGNGLLAPSESYGDLATMLEELDLRNSQIGPDGAKAVAAMASNIASITSVRSSPTHQDLVFKSPVPDLHTCFSYCVCSAA